MPVNKRHYAASTDVLGAACSVVAVINEKDVEGYVFGQRFGSCYGQDDDTCG